MDVVEDCGGECARVDISAETAKIISESAAEISAYRARVEPELALRLQAHQRIVVAVGKVFGVPDAWTLQADGTGVLFFAPAPTKTI